MLPARHTGGQRAPLTALLVLACLSGPMAAPPGAAPRGFVTRAGTGFVLDGAPFHVVGANQCVPRGGTAWRDMRGCEGAARSAAALKPARVRIATVTRCLGTHWSTALAGRRRSRLATAFALVGCQRMPRSATLTANDEQMRAVLTAKSAASRHPCGADTTS